MSSATEQLRAGLDEREIEYTALNGVATDIRHDGMLTRVFDYGDDPDCQMCIETRCKTTEQAIDVIAATLGPGTCEMEYVGDFMSWHCKACGQLTMMPRNPKPTYCMWCGAKAVS